MTDTLELCVIILNSFTFLYLLYITKEHERKLEILMDDYDAYYGKEE